MTDEITCPADGCDYDGLPESVAGHAQGKRDDPHRGISYSDVMDSQGNSGGSTSSASASQPSSTSAGGDNPTVGSGDVAADTGDTDAAELPCGHESIDPEECPDTPFRVACDTCGGSWLVRDE